VTSPRRASPASPFIAVACLAILPVQGSPPLTTDDAATLDPGACQAETEYRQFHRREELDLVPACNLVFDAELAIGLLRTAPDGARRIDATFYQVKKVFVPVAESSWGFGMSAGTARASGAHQNYFTMLLTREFDNIRVHVNVGLVQDSGAQEELRRNRSSWGLAAENQVSDRWTVVAEAFGQQGLPEAAQVGLRWWAMPKHVQLTSSIGAQRGLGREGRWVSLGIRLETGEPVF
jgi:hypothetical protein